jgi:hypothetical protein
MSSSAAAFAAADAGGDGCVRHHTSGASCRVVTDRTSVRPGGQIQVSGSGFQPGERVTVLLQPGAEFLATLRADAYGFTQAELLVPATAHRGDGAVVIDGRSSNRELTAPLRVGTRSTTGHRSRAGQASGAAMLPATSTASSDQSFRGGAAAIPLGAAAAAMMLAGGLTLTSVRHRRRPDLSR